MSYGHKCTSGLCKQRIGQTITKTGDGPVQEQNIGLFKCSQCQAASSGFTTFLHLILLHFSPTPKGVLRMPGSASRDSDSSML